MRKAAKHRAQTDPSRHRNVSKIRQTYYELVMGHHKSNSFPERTGLKKKGSYTAASSTKGVYDSMKTPPVT